MGKSVSRAEKGRVTVLGQEVPHIPNSFYSNTAERKERLKQVLEMIGISHFPARCLRFPFPLYSNPLVLTLQTNRFPVNFPTHVRLLA